MPRKETRFFTNNERIEELLNEGFLAINYEEMPRSLNASFNSKDYFFPTNIRCFLNYINRLPDPSEAEELIKRAGFSGIIIVR